MGAKNQTRLCLHRLQKRDSRAPLHRAMRSRAHLHDHLSHTTSLGGYRCTDAENNSYDERDKQYSRRKLHIGISSVCTIHSRSLRISKTVPKISSTSLVCINCIKRSMAMKVPERPTPALNGEQNQS